MSLPDIILLFFFLSSLALNIWLLWITIPWKERTAEFYLMKFRQLFASKWMELTPEERLELWRVYNESSPHNKKAWREDELEPD
jgi:hypothetical protein